MENKITADEIAKRNAEREAELDALIKNGEIGLMTEAAYGTTIAQVTESKPIVSKESKKEEG